MRVPCLACVVTLCDAFMCFSGIEFGWCQNASCQQVLFSVAHFQLKLRSFILNDGRPPLKEAYFLVRLPQQYIVDLLDSCPAALVGAYFVVAEVEAMVAPSDAQKFYGLGHDILLDLPEKYGQEYLDGVYASGWPVVQQMQRIEDALGYASERLLAIPQTLDVVVARCHEDLGWLTDGTLEFPPRERVQLVVYEKCGGGDVLGTEGIFGGVTVIDRPDGKVRGDECVAYLAYLTDWYDNYADHVIFLQGDAPDHLLPPYLNLVLAAITTNQFIDPFLHLNADRHVYTQTPCLKAVYKQLFGKELDQLVGSYCCAQFVVSRDALQAHSVMYYRAVLRLIDTGQDLCFEDPVRSSYCYILEVLWHAIWGEPLDLPLRQDDHRLRPTLRRKYGDEHVRNDWAGLEFMPSSPRRIVASDHVDLPSSARLEADALR